jgi:hypothetical protein
MKIALLFLFLTFSTYAAKPPADSDVVIDDIHYPSNELPLVVSGHLVYTQHGIVVGFFLAEGTLFYGAKSGKPQGYFSNGTIYFTFPNK